MVSVTMVLSTIPASYLQVMLTVWISSVFDSLITDQTATMLTGFAYFNLSLAIGVISVKGVAKLIGMLV